jgi:hypothetical protein
MAYLNHRVKMEPDFYEEPSSCPFPALRDTFEVRKSRGGDFASQAVWLVIQHSDLELQKQYLPQLEEAERNGDLPPAMIATLKDRIDVREGRPQKYGTQCDMNGKLSPLLDASRVNEWRQEVGLPLIDVR